VIDLKFYLEKFTLPVGESPSFATLAVIDELLKIQNQNALQNIKATSEGFLVTIWSRQDVIELLEKGAYVWLARNIEDHLLQAYLVVSGIDLFLESINVPEVSFRSDIDPRLLNVKSLYLYQLAVTPNLCHLGLGSKLIANVLATEKTNFTADIMKSPQHNLASFGLLQKFGFRISGEVHFSNYRNFGECQWLVMGLEKIRLPSI
jgi:ribosomal protein S18 acetylase RimI-like enzyme